MKIKLMRKVEHWRDSGAVQNIIDQAESAAGYTPDDGQFYDDFIDEFSTLVADAIRDAGHDIEWVYQQSRGVGAVVQNKDAAASEAFDAAVEACKDEWMGHLMGAISIEAESMELDD